MQTIHNFGVPNFTGQQSAQVPTPSPQSRRLAEIVKRLDGLKTIASQCLKRRDEPAFQGDMMARNLIRDIPAIVAELEESKLLQSLASELLDCAKLFKGSFGKTE